MHKTIATAMAAVVLATTWTPALAAPQGNRAPGVTQSQPLESYAQYRRRGSSAGAAAAAGVLGLAAGALIGGAIANQAQAAPPPPPATVDPQLAAWCARRYQSFDPVTGTYLSRSGEWIVCTYP